MKLMISKLFLTVFVLSAAIGQSAFALGFNNLSWECGRVGDTTYTVRGVEPGSHVVAVQVNVTSGNVEEGSTNRFLLLPIGGSENRTFLGSRAKFEEGDGDPSSCGYQPTKSAQLTIDGLVLSCKVFVAGRPADTGCN